MKSTTKTMAAIASVAIILFAMVPVVESDAAPVTMTNAEYYPFKDGKYVIDMTFSDALPTKANYALYIDDATVPMAKGITQDTSQTSIAIVIKAALSEGTHKLRFKVGSVEATYDNLVVKTFTEHTVSFDPSGGTGTMASEKVVDGKMYSLPACTFGPPAGKEFAGWSLTPGGTIPATNPIYIGKNVTLYAIWKETIPKFQVSFNSNNGTGTMAPVMTSGEYTLPPCTFDPPAGKQFAGWSLTADGTIVTKIDVSAATEVFAIWENKTYEVSFDPNGGAGTMAPVMTSGVFTLPPCTFDPPAGKQFAGWSKTADGSTPVTEVYVDNNVTVYATWADKTFDLTFTAGTYGSVDTKSLTVPYGSKISVAGNFLLVDGKTVTATPDASDAQYTYAFASWSIADGTVVTENLEIKASFDRTVNKCAVKWFVDGELYASDMVEYGDTPVAPKDPTRASADPAVEYKFAGWYGYTPGMTVDKDLDFTALFDTVTNMVDLTFSAGTYGSVDTKSLTVPYGSVISVVGSSVVVDGKTVMAIPEASDVQYTYSFASWNVSDGDVADKDMAIEASFDRTVNKYAVKWFVDGELYHSEMVEYGDTPVAPKDPTRASADPAVEYKFAGWYGYTPGMTVDKDLDFTAMFDTITNMVDLTFSAGTYGSVDTKSLTVPYGSVISVVGSSVVVDGKTVMAIPEASDVQYTYSFKEWNVSDGTVADKDMVIEASFDRTVNKYSVTWMADGKVYDTQMVDYGSSPAVPKDPTKPSTDPAFTYAFDGWSGYTSGMKITGDAIFVAEFKVVPNMVKLTFTAGTHGSVDTASLTVPYGSKISVAGNAIVVDGKKVLATPMTSDVQYTYSFVSWSIADGTVADKNLEAKATFSQAINQYTVTWIVEGAIYDSQTLNYGEAPTVPEIPTKTSADPRYTYEFSGWDGYKMGMKITGDTTITGGFKTIKHYSEDVKISLRTSANGVSVLITATDGKIVPEGSYSVSYSITYYSSALKMYVTKTVNLVSENLTNTDEASSIVKNQKLTDQPNYSKITKAWAYYKGVDGSDDRSDIISYIPAKTA